MGQAVSLLAAESPDGGLSLLESEGLPVVELPPPLLPSFLASPAAEVLVVISLLALRFPSLPFSIRKMMRPGSKAGEISAEVKGGDLSPTDEPP